MAYFTLSITGTPDERQRASVESLVRECGGRVDWRINAEVGRSYALIEMSQAGAKALQSIPDATVSEGAIIALAVSPTVPEALPHLIEALEGAGRPRGILGCRAIEGGVIVEWDPNISPADIVMGVIDVELRRFASGRSAALLSPLPPWLAAKVAADGLEAPEIHAGRVLELLIDDV